MKNFVDYTSRKCFASARVARRGSRLGYAIPTHTRKISFSGLVIQITIAGLVPRPILKIRGPGKPQELTIHLTEYKEV
jgi:hypothetical protein